MGIRGICYKGLRKVTPKQFAEFLEYVKKNNSWGMNMYEVCHVRKRVAYKYIDAVWDSRNNKVFAIKLRVDGGSGKTFSVDTPEEIKALYDYLDKSPSEV
ncbi:MAG: hypothetical protein IJY30_02320 [Muribaculaceae bacterium]|nr:hypothetical protein [Muribaculaceae bacterium]